MKSRKGFTLVELLGVITIIGVLTLLAVPSIDAIITAQRKKAYDTQIQTIKDGLRTWGNSNALALPEENEGSLTINLGVLKLAGFVKQDITNPNTDLCFANDMSLTISSVKGGYDYYVDEESGLNGTSDDCSVPNVTSYLVVIGSKELTIYQNQVYNDLGINIFDSNGSAVIDKYTTVITDKDGNVVTSIDSSTDVSAPYLITYTYNGNSVTRTININMQDPKI